MSYVVPYRPRRSSRACCGRAAASTLAAAIILTLSAAAARAQEVPAPAVEVHGYHPSPFSDRLLRLDGTATLPAWAVRVGLDADYAAKPLVVTLGTDTGGATEHALIRHAVGANLAFAVGVAERLELAALLPITAYRTGETVPGVAPPARAGLEAARLGFKLRIAGDGRSGAGLGASALVAIPTGAAGGLLREDGLGGEGRIFADLRQGALTLGLAGGARLRRAARMYDVALGNELFAAAGAELRLPTDTAVIAELAASTAAAHPFAETRQSPVEALVGVRQRLGQLSVLLAGGPGLQDGYGAPLYRGVLALAWSNAPPPAPATAAPADRDGDGLLDGADRCPTEPEDKDGFQDADGCPDPDNDKDGIPDRTDRCPDQPETRNGYRDDDGCPDKNLHAIDTDRDGVMDDKDLCLDVPEDKDGFEDEDGCPELDNDKDGIPDTADKCPLEPETINNVDDQDGCPDKGIVRLGENELETLTPIFFDKDRARIHRAFRPTLDAIAGVLVAHPEIGRCAVEGHTDASGPPDWNQVLSKKRADQVVKYLAAKGVTPERLTSIGQGDALPWASNKTEEGRAANRRVLFHIEGVAADKQLEIQRERAARKLGTTVEGAPAAAAGAAAPAAAVTAPAAPPVEPAPAPADDAAAERRPPLDRPGDAL